MKVIPALPKKLSNKESDLYNMIKLFCELNGFFIMSVHDQRVEIAKMLELRKLIKMNNYLPNSRCYSYTLKE